MIKRVSRTSPRHPLSSSTCSTIMEVKKNKQEQQQQMQQKTMSYTEFCSKVKERKMRNNTQIYVVHPWVRLHPREGNRKPFITDAIYKWKLVKIQGILTLYKQRTKQKNNIINCHMDFSHNPTSTLAESSSM